MDSLLKALAAVALDVSAAEAALDEGASGAARDRLEAAAAGLTELRARWPALAARERLPARAALSVGAAEADPEQELDPLAQRH